MYIPIKKVRYLLIILFLLVAVHVTFLSFTTYGNRGYLEPPTNFVGKIYYLNIIPQYAIIFIYLGYLIIATFFTLSIKYIEKNPENVIQGIMPLKINIQKITFILLVVAVILSGILYLYQNHQINQMNSKISTMEYTIDDLESKIVEFEERIADLESKDKTHDSIDRVRENRVGK